MIRPVDWAPLGARDPLPGDPEEITHEAARLARLGAEMRTQAATLRQIGADDSLAGQYADALRREAGALAGDLTKVADRYERVAAALQGWGPELAEAQARTLTARTKAIAAEELRARHEPLIAEPIWGPPAAQALLPGPEAAARSAGLDEAEAMLAEAQRMLRDTLDYAEGRGRYYAGLIEEAIHILKDGRWANFKDWVDRNADWIERYTDDLGWVATAAAIGAIFLPGPNILILTALGITTLSAVTHTGLLATGNGSWTDLGMDAFALATFGAGNAAARGLTRAELVARSAAASEAKEIAVEAALRTAGNARAENAFRGLRGLPLDRIAAEEARAAVVARQALEAGANAARDVMHAPLAPATHLDAVLVGDEALARRFNHVLSLAARYPASVEVADALSEGMRYYSAAQIAFLSGTLADLAGKAEAITSTSRFMFTRVESSFE